MLPDIDYSKYDSGSGMATKEWGPSAWNFIFTSIMGRYPIEIDLNNSEHIIIQNAFKYMLMNLQIIMPCIFCRESFKIFLLELPLEPYLSGRFKLMYWLYLMKDKVNQKLLKQEKKCYNNKKSKLKEMFYNNKISEKDYYRQIKKLKADIFKTTPTPTFKEVLDHYETLRAVCSKSSKTCKLPKKSNKN